MTTDEIIALKDAGAVEIELHPDGSLARVRFAPSYPMPTPMPRGDVGDSPAKPTRNERLAGKHSGLRPRDIRKAWVEATGGLGPRQ